MNEQTVISSDDIPTQIDDAFKAFMKQHGTGLRAVLSEFPDIDADGIILTMTKSVRKKPTRYNAMNICIRVVDLLLKLEASDAIGIPERPAVNYDVGAALRWYAGRLTDIANRA